MSSPLSSSHPSAEDIAAREPREPGFLILPEASTCFAEREMRLRQLAAGHPMGDFLRFVADIAHLQQEALDRFPAVPLPDAEALRQAALFGQPPLPAAHWPRDPAWQACVRDMAHALSHKAPEAALSALKTLEQASGEWLETQADRLLNGISTGLDVAAAPLIGCLMLGNLFKESGATARLSDTAQNSLNNIVVILLGVTVGATANGQSFLQVKTLLIVGLGLIAFAFSTVGGVLLGKLLGLLVLSDRLLAQGLPAAEQAWTSAIATALDGRRLLRYKGKVWTCFPLWMMQHCGTSNSCRRLMGWHSEAKPWSGQPCLLAA